MAMKTADVDKKTVKKGVKSATGTKEETPKKNKKKIFILIGLVIIVLGSLGGFLILSSPSKPAPLPPGASVSIAQTTINLADGHLLQVSYTIQLIPGGKSSSVMSKQPEILNKTIEVFGSWTYTALLAPGGRQQARVELKNQLQPILQLNKKNQIAHIYFTSFIMQ